MIFRKKEFLKNFRRRNFSNFFFFFFFTEDAFVSFPEKCFIRKKERCIFMSLRGSLKKFPERKVFLITIRLWRQVPFVSWKNKRIARYNGDWFNFFELSPVGNIIAICCRAITICVISNNDIFLFYNNETKERKERKNGWDCEIN